MNTRQAAAARLLLNVSALHGHPHVQTCIEPDGWLVNWERLDLDAHRIGYMNTPANRHRMNGWIWAADNGCYGKNYVGDARWFAWLNSHTAEEKAQCLFATAPDVVGDAYATLERSTPWLPRIREAGYPVALVAQDGLTTKEIPWDDIDAIFIGGSTEWKLGTDAATILTAGRKYGKHTHVGRVNSRSRYRRMAMAGADSMDGTYIAFGPSINAPKVFNWVDEYKNQQSLF